MRILTVGNMYPPHSLGGYELLWQSWVRNAEARGHEVRVLTSDVRFDWAAGETDTVEVRRQLRWYWSEHEWPRHTARECLAIERGNADLFDRTLAEFRPDAVVWWSMAGMSVSLDRASPPSRSPGGCGARRLLARVRERGRRVAGAVFRGGAGGSVRVASAPTGQIIGVDLASASRVSSPPIGCAPGPGAWCPTIEDVAVIPHPPPEVERFELVPERPWHWDLVYVGRIVDVKGVDLAVEALAKLPDGGDPRRSTAGGTTTTSGTLPSGSASSGSQTASRSIACPGRDPGGLRRR